VCNGPMIPPSIVRRWYLWRRHAVCNEEFKSH